jgi:hypothetical protein
MQRGFIVSFALSCVLLCAAFAQSQTAPPPPSAPSSGTPTPPAAAPAGPAANPSAVAPDQAVITLPGSCDAKAGGPKPGTGCVNSVTKDQFEKLTTALKPDLTAEQKRNFAQHYGTLLVFSNAGRALGLENDPKYQLIMQFAANQILVDVVREHYTNEYAHPTDQQIDDYYKQNAKKFAEAKLQRVIVPRSQAAGDKAKPTDAEEQAYADQIRQKWTSGSDPAKLQTEAFEHAGIKATAPDVNFGDKRPGSLPPAHEGVFELKAGEISQAYADPSGFYLYKVVSTREVPLTEVKDSIAKTLSQQELKDKLESINASVTPVLNETYFGPAAPPPPAGAMGGPRSMPSGAAPQAPPPMQAPPK